MNYVKKTNIVKAVQWTGDIDKIKGIDWIEKEIENKNILFTDDSTMLFRTDSKGNNYTILDEGNYICRFSDFGELKPMKENDIKNKYFKISEKFNSDRKKLTLREILNSFEFTNAVKKHCIYEYVKAIGGKPGYSLLNNHGLTQFYTHAKNNDKQYMLQVGLRDLEEKDGKDLFEYEIAIKGNNLYLTNIDSEFLIMMDLFIKEHGNYEFDTLYSE